MEELCEGKEDNNFSPRIEKKGSHKADLALVPDLGMVVAWKKFTPTC
jgi:hypothetical protein